MTPAELHAYTLETQVMAEENHRRALAMYDLIFPPWRWRRWYREYKAVKAVIRETRRRNEFTRQQLGTS
jgi:hypothetical protein